MTKLLLTVNEAAEWYKVDGMRLRALAARGSLTLHRMDGAIYLEDEQCAALVRRQCPQCLEYFTPASNRQKYCTTRCRQRAFRGASH